MGNPLLSGGLNQIPELKVNDLKPAKANYDPRNINDLIRGPKEHRK
jgi:hypothetical protein